MSENFKAPECPFLVPYDGSFRVTEAATGPAEGDRDRDRKQLRKAAKQLGNLQRLIRANDTWSVLLVFQGMDASGKDGTIRAVLSAVNPAGCQVASFKTPTRHELDHDFLWRTTLRLPERGRIGIFNRSQYEDVLIVQVHPKYLDNQQLPRTVDPDSIWKERLESIRNQEQHLARNGMVILKFWLNVSFEEQGRRFLSRLEERDKIWKFKTSDVAERGFWDRYMQCYEEALNGTSRPWAPWYAIPADNKPYMRARVAEIVVAALEGLNLQYPQPSEDERLQFEAACESLRL